MKRDERAPKPTPRPADDPARVAIISLHTSPRDQPGAGDSGGMNVYMLAVAERLAEQGIAVDVFTRARGDGVPEVEEIVPGSRIIQVRAGPPSDMPKENLPALLPEFLGGVLDRAAREHQAHRHHPYDVVHSHYWLSGWVGSRAKEIWGAPLVASFHTLGRVKNASPSSSLIADEPAARLLGEQRVVRGADRIVSPTPAEAADLVTLYGADPERIRVVAPGVDHCIFVPRPKEEARRRLNLGRARLVLFVGRLQPFKGPDVAIRALARAIATAPELTEDVVLWVVGGPSSPSGPDEMARLSSLAASLGIGGRVSFVAPQPHERLSDFYSAADVLLVPSRSESFGLVALEAQACGTPVIGTAAGGLRHIVKDGGSGFLVEGQDPEAYAARLVRILGDPELAARFSSTAARNAARFSWEATTADIRNIYRELLRRRAA